MDVKPVQEEFKSPSQQILSKPPRLRINWTMVTFEEVLEENETKLRWKRANREV